MLHGLSFREEAGARNLVFFRVKWLQPAMKGTFCVRRAAAIVSGVIGSPLVFSNMWVQIALQWLHGYV